MDKPRSNKLFGPPDNIPEDRSGEQQQDEDRARLFIERHPWRFAKSMPGIPHAYVVKTYLKYEDQFEFEWFVIASRQWGKPTQWGKKTYIYWTIDEYNYWTMGSPLDKTIIINRAKI